MTPALLTAVLCTTPAHAVSYEIARGVGLSEPMAIDRVGKTAGHQVCGAYSGRAAVVQEQTVIRDGVLFRVTLWRLAGRRPEAAWQAESAIVSASKGGRA